MENDEITRTPRAKETTSRDLSGRVGGKFAKGNRFGRGRPKSSLTAALRAITDPDSVASHLLAIIEDDRTSTKDRLRAIEIVFDRLEGRAVARSIRISSAADVLPVGFFDLPPARRSKILDDIRARALQGALPVIDVPSDDHEHEHDGATHEE